MYGFPNIRIALKLEDKKFFYSKEAKEAKRIFKEFSGNSKEFRGIKIYSDYRFRSYDFWVMSPTRFHCAKPLSNLIFVVIVRMNYVIYIYRKVGIKKELNKRPYKTSSALPLRGA